MSTRIFTSKVDLRNYLVHNFRGYSSYITNGRTIIDPYTDTLDSTHYAIIPRLCGGDDIFDPVMSILDMIFGPLLKPIQAIMDVFVYMIKAVIWLGLFIIWLVQFIIWLIVAMINIPNDFFNSMLMITSSLLLAIPQGIYTIIKMLTNTIGKQIFSSFWGWDNNPNTTRKSKYETHRNHKSKCYVAVRDGSVPFSTLLGTLVMPPIGVFMTLGLSGWVHILIACFLTIMYYVPGLIYALLIVYG